MGRGKRLWEWVSVNGIHLPRSADLSTSFRWFFIKWVGCGGWCLSSMIRFCVSVVFPASSLFSVGIFKRLSWSTRYSRRAPGCYCCCCSFLSLIFPEIVPAILACGLLQIKSNGLKKVSAENKNCLWHAVKPTQLNSHHCNIVAYSEIFIQKYATAHAASCYISMHL